MNKSVDSTPKMGSTTGRIMKKAEELGLLRPVSRSHPTCAQILNSTSETELRQQLRRYTVTGEHASLHSPGELFFFPIPSSPRHSAGPYLAFFWSPPRMYVSIGMMYAGAWAHLYVTWVSKKKVSTATVKRTLDNGNQQLFFSWRKKWATVGKKTKKKILH